MDINPEQQIITHPICLLLPDEEELMEGHLCALADEKLPTHTNVKGIASNVRDFLAFSISCRLMYTFASWAK